MVRKRSDVPSCHLTKIKIHFLLLTYSNCFLIGSSKPFVTLLTHSNCFLIGCIKHQFIHNYKLLTWISFIHRVLKDCEICIVEVKASHRTLSTKTTMMTTTVRIPAKDPWRVISHALH
jgi:hypothetical protein